MFSYNSIVNNVFQTNNQLHPKFKMMHNFDTRFEESQRILHKYPDRIPIICEPSKTSSPQIDKTKYLVPRDLTVGQFLYVIRKRMSLSPEQAIYLFIGGTIPTTSEMMNVIYENHRDADGFLYVYYSCENTFG